MRTRTIKITDLSVDSINELINEFQDEETWMKSKLALLMEELSVLGYQSAIKNVPIWTGELARCIDASYNDDSASIFVNNEYAIFVEFGTGLVGKGTYQGNLPSNYVCGNGPTVGLYSFENGDAIGWWYYNEELGRYVFTEGMVASSFMFKSSQELRRKLSSIVGRVFK